MTCQTHTLTNGIKLILKPDISPVTYCGIAINTGSRDESNSEEGMAHFIEHMLFKGTHKRRSGHIINRLEHVGGELNAFTTKEETVVYAAVLTEYFERAFELLADIVTDSVFPQKEIDKEIVIILDEIQSYNDSPSELIYDDFEELLFENHELGHNILGRSELLKNYNTEDALKFVERQYQPDQLVFFAVGNIQFNKLIKLCEKHLNIPASSKTPRIRKAPDQYIPKQKEIIKNTHQIHYMVGNRAYDLHHPMRMAMYLLNNILGGPGMNSLLNLSLREKHGLVYNVESNYQPFTDTGYWSVYFGCDPENARKCEQLLFAELLKLREQPISEQSLKKYKLQLTGQMAIANEQKETLALGIGKSFLRFGQIDDTHVIKERIESITATQLQQIACDIFDPQKLSILKYT